MSLSPAEMGKDITRFWRAKALKEHKAATVAGVNYGHVLAFHIYDASVRASFRRALWALFIKFNYSGSPDASPGLLFFSFGDKMRPDYEFMVDMVESLGNDQYQRIDVTEGWALTQWARTLPRIPAALRLVLRAMHKESVLCRVALALVAAKCMAERGRAGRLVRDRQKVVTFCDASPLDNLVAQLSHLDGIPTITLQHGQYRRLNEANMSPDAEAIHNFISGRMLAWGPATVSELMKAGIDEERLAVVGWIRNWPEISPSKSPLGQFGVMLNGVNGAESNTALLDIAARIADQLDLTYTVRLHPSFGADLYEAKVTDKCTGLSSLGAKEYVESVDFSLGHMSGAVIELLRYGSPVYVWDDGRLAEVFCLPELTFDSLDLLVARIQKPLFDEQRRAKILHKWFNADNDQRRLIQEQLQIEMENSATA